MNCDAPDLSGKDPEWWLSGARGALHNLPPGALRDAALDRLTACQTVVALLRREEESRDR